MSKSANDCLLVDPILADATGFFGHNLLDLIGSMEIWASKDQQTTASRLSLKVCGLAHSLSLT